MEKRSRVEKAPIEESKEYLKNLVPSLSTICIIDKQKKQCDVEKKIDSYKNTDSYIENKPSDCTYECGRLWLLVGENEADMSAITLGQSLNIFNEIKTIVQDIYYIDDNVKKILKDVIYPVLKKDYARLIFYEVPIDNYLNTEFINICEMSGIAKIIYDMSKEYFAEARIAYKTGALYWNYFNSGMDKRAYFHNLKMIADERKAKHSITL